MMEIVTVSILLADTAPAECFILTNHLCVFVCLYVRYVALATQKRLWRFVHTGNRQKSHRCLPHQLGQAVCWLLNHCRE